MGEGKVGNMEKEEIRQKVWRLLEVEEVARFPFPTVGRIPNFEGAEQAATCLAGVDCWQDARSLKATPDSPQKRVRQLALSEGKTVYMAVPRLTKAECFLELNPSLLRKPERASTIKGAFAMGNPVRPEKVKKVDLVVMGSVAVDSRGGRVGKGGGYSDLEYALGRAFGFVTGETPVVTTVHPIQFLEEVLPMGSHDVPLDWAATPSGVTRMPKVHRKPMGIDWDLLPKEKVAAIPILGELRRRGELA